jgi:hypothetical protein
VALLAQQQTQIELLTRLLNTPGRNPANEQ